MTFITKWKKRTDPFGDVSWIRQIGSTGTVVAKIKQKDVTDLRQTFRLSICIGRHYFLLGVYSTLRMAKKKLPEKLRMLVACQSDWGYSGDITKVLKEEGLKTGKEK